jgi:hypothetical protein
MHIVLSHSHSTHLIGQYQTLLLWLSASDALFCVAFFFVFDNDPSSSTCTIQVGICTDFHSFAVPFIIDEDGAGCLLGLGIIN